MKKSILHVMGLSITLIFSFLHAHKVSEKYIEFFNHEVFIPQSLGDIKLYKDYDGFHVVKNNEVYDVQNCFCDPMLKKMTNKQLMSFLGRNKSKVIEITQECLDQISEEDILEIIGDEKDMILSQLSNDCGYIKINQMSDGQYRLELKMRLCGGRWKDNIKIFAVHFFGIVLVVSCGALVGTVSALLAEWPVGIVAGLSGLASGITGGVASGIMLTSDRNKKHS